MTPEKHAICREVSGSMKQWALFERPKEASQVTSNQAFLFDFALQLSLNKEGRQDSCG